MCSIAFFFILLWIGYHFISKIFSWLFSGGIHSTHTSPKSSKELQQDFTACMFSLLTKLSMADGKISQPEVDAINTMAKNMFSDSKRDYIRTIIAKARKENRPVDYYLNRYARSWGQNIEIVQIMLECLCTVALTDGELSNSEMQILLTIEKFFNFNGFVISYLQNAQHRNGNYNYNNHQSNTRQHQSSGSDSYSGQHRYQTNSSSNSALELDDYYRILGCSPNDDINAIKSAYRNLCKKYHPDVLQSKGLPPELLKKASEKMQSINEAYQKIKDSRGI